MNNMWMVRAGKNAQYLDGFTENSLITVGWTRMGDLSGFQSQSQLKDEVSRKWPEWSNGKQAISASQLWRFAHEINKGDPVITYDPHRRIYLYGIVTGEYSYNPGLIEDNPHTRAITWKTEIDRDRLSTGTKNSLGAILTLFRIPDHAAEEIEAVRAGNVDMAVHAEEEATDEGELIEDIEEKAIEFIKDKITKLEWDQMQELVAGLLRAMGYKTKVSPTGPDRGKDIVASPDGFGFESPRIVVEVKHRHESMNSNAIRSFLGGRHKDDKGLFVSTGGFTKDAYYEAERANIPVTLMTLDELVKAIIEHYERIDMETKRLVPLKRVYWPV